MAFSQVISKGYLRAAASGCFVKSNFWTGKSVLKSLKPSLIYCLNLRWHWDLFAVSVISVTAVSSGSCCSQVFCRKAFLNISRISRQNFCSKIVFYDVRANVSETTKRLDFNGLLVHCTFVNVIVEGLPYTFINDLSFTIKFNFCFRKVLLFLKGLSTKCPIVIWNCKCFHVAWSKNEIKLNEWQPLFGGNPAWTCYFPKNKYSWGNYLI